MARPIAERLEKPLVVISANAVALQQIAALGERLMFVVVGPGFEPRLRVVFGERARS